jgi:GDP-mannose 6-dehydrogenase
VIVRSTVLPGTTRNIIIPALCEGFGGNISGRISVAINPEFLREGTAIEDYLNPPKTIVGSDDVSCADAVANIYAKISAPVFRTSVEVAEMAKYVDNSWHALKVTFANEIGWLCGRLGVDSSQVMDIFVKDTKLNISPYYLRPGFAFGGSCLPKDVRALVHRAKATDLTLPVLENIMNSNRQQLERVIDLVVASPGRRVAILGLTFKANTDDLRESPFVELTERIIGKGYDVRIYDHNISMQAMVGANKEYAERMIPHLSRLLVHSITDALSHAETVIVSHATPETLTVPALMREHQTLIDLTRLSTRRETAGHYVGIN